MRDPASQDGAYFFDDACEHLLHHVRFNCEFVGRNRVEPHADAIG